MYWVNEVLATCKPWRAWRTHHNSTSSNKHPCQRSHTMYPGGYEPPCDDHLNLWVGFLLDARAPARDTTHARRKGNNNGASPATTTTTTTVSSPVSKTSPLSPGGKGTGPGVGGSLGSWNGPAEGWRRGEVFLVNPSEMVSAEGVRRFPKGTFGIR